MGGASADRDTQVSDMCLSPHGINLGNKYRQVGLEIILDEHWEISERFAPGTLGKVPGAKCCLV